MTLLFYVIILSLGVILVWSISSEVAREDEARKRHGHEYSSSAQQRIKSDCLNREPVAIAQCVQEIIDATRENERAEDDVYAQLGMHRWSFWMFIASLAAVGVTGVGVIYVARTLGEAQKTTAAAIEAASAAREANQIMRDEQRPWLVALTPAVTGLTSVIEKNASGERIDQEYFCFSPAINIPIINSGSIPATNVFIFARHIDRYIKKPKSEIFEHGGGVIYDAGNDQVFLDIGIKEFFKNHSGGVFPAGLGTGCYTIAQNDRFDYYRTGVGLNTIRISKDDRSFDPRMIRCLVVTITYESPGRPDLFISQFAFDLWGNVRDEEVIPPAGHAFASGEGIFYRQAESQIK